MSSISILEAFNACDDAIEWAEAQPDQSPNELWRECPRADWMLWYLGALAVRDGRGSPAHRRAVLITCLCARVSSCFWRDSSCEKAVSLAERWAWGRAMTCDELHAVAAAVVYANTPDTNTCVSDTAHAAAARTAYAAGVYVDSAYGAAIYAANAYARTAAYAVADSARTGVYTTVRTAYLADLADMIRAAIPEVPL